MSPEQQPNSTEPVSPPEVTPVEPTNETSPAEVTPTEAPVNVEQAAPELEVEPEKPLTMPSSETVNTEPMPVENEPLPEATPEPNAGMVVPPKKSNKKLVIMLAIIIGALLIVFGGAWAAYALWYNNPENAVQDALSKALSAKSVSTNSTITASSNGLTAKIDFTTATNEAQQSSLDMNLTFNGSNLNYTVKGHAVSTPDAVYVKLDDIRTLLSKLMGTGDTSVIEQYYGSLLDKIDGKWVVIKQSDLKDLSNGSVTDKETQCFQNEFAKLQSDSSVRNEVMTIYKQHPLFTIESKGSDSDGNHYNLVPVSDSQAKEFATAVVDTKFFKALDDCTSDDLKTSFVNSFNDTTTNESSNNATGSLELWVDPLTHDLKKLTLGVRDSATTLDIAIKPTFNTNPSITVPTSDTTVNDIKTEIQNIFSGFTAPSSATTTYPITKTSQYY